MALKNRHTGLARYIMVEFYQTVLLVSPSPKHLHFAKVETYPQMVAFAFEHYFLKNQKTHFLYPLKIFVVAFYEQSMRSIQYSVVAVLFHKQKR